MREYGVGIIGAGFMGKTHTYDYITMPLFYDNMPFRIKLVGICNRTLSKAEFLKEYYGFEFATDRYEDIIERDDIDIVDICTPNDVHYEQIVAAIKAEKNLYVDKPLCIKDEDADSITNLLKNSSIIHQMAFNLRFFPAVKKMKLMIDEGFIGVPISFRITYYHASNLNPKISRGWRQDINKAGGGVLYDMGSHALDMAYYLLGRFEKLSMISKIVFPERIDENGNTVVVKTEDHVIINAKMENGSCGTIEVSKVVFGSNDDLVVEIYGTEGAMRFNSMNPNFLYVYDSRDPGDPIGGSRGYKLIETINKDPDSKSKFPGPRFPIGWIRSHLACHYNFMKNLYNGTQPEPSVFDGAYIQKIMNSLYRISNKEEWLDVKDLY